MYLKVQKSQKSLIYLPKNLIFSKPISPTVDKYMVWSEE